MGDVLANKCKNAGKKKKRKAEVFELFPALQACSATSKFTTNTLEESEVQIRIQDVSRQRHPILISLCTISFVLLKGQVHGSAHARYCTHFRHPTDEQLRHVDTYFLATKMICSLSTLN